MFEFINIININTNDEINELIIKNFVNNSLFIDVLLNIIRFDNNKISAVNHKASQLLHDIIINSIIILLILINIILLIINKRIV